MNQVEKSVPLTIAGRNKLTTQIRSYLLVVLLCMYRIIRPDYEVVKEGRILHFVLDYKRFEGKAVTRSDAHSNDMISCFEQYNLNFRLLYSCLFQQKYNDVVNFQFKYYPFNIVKF